ncbi:hypothetical protein VC83_03317 [Pseudogymnoascus destructans]|uniref:Uncharacterized protein n=1 Tax=Pseudogymnoascus destructans TaxID=655981 RepID=A0A177AES7_9PEZI|nr:uncharacterized protein VC83_03317 [Pseudogymnoascus destructans]OAF60577.1 hypothetical protein VC83_03317 [Pseudogymnoascus destructans]
MSRMKLSKDDITPNFFAAMRGEFRGGYKDQLTIQEILVHCFAMMAKSNAITCARRSSEHHRQDARRIILQEQMSKSRGSNNSQASSHAPSIVSVDFEVAIEAIGVGVSADVSEFDWATQRNSLKLGTSRSKEF